MESATDRSEFHESSFSVENERLEVFEHRLLFGIVAVNALLLALIILIFPALRESRAMLLLALSLVWIPIWAGYRFFNRTPVLVIGPKSIYHRSFGTVVWDQISEIRCARF